MEERPLSVGLRIVGQAAKRGIIPRLPGPDALLGEVERWLGIEAADTATRAPWVAFGTPVPTLRTSLHPAASDVEFVADDAARLTVSAQTAEAGPGYHTYVCQLLRRMGTELRIDWEPADPAAGTGDETGYFESGQRSDAETALLFWLRDSLQAACDARERGKPPVQLVASPNHRFTFEGPIATALGPRDDEWLRAAVNDPRIAADVWPWVADAMDARYLLNRALVLMWTRVRWRTPGTDDERETMDEVLRLLRKAFPFDPDLPYPWREWRDILDLSGAQDPMAERIAREAERAEGAAGAAPIGYRRNPVVVVHGGWAITIPGSFAERENDGEWWAGEGGRSITLAATATGTDGGGPMSAEDFIARVAGDLGAGALEHRDGPVVGRAKLAVDEGSEVGLAVLDAYSAIRGRGAAMKVEIHDPADWEWALDMWRSLKPA